MSHRVTPYAVKCVAPFRGADPHCPALTVRQCGADDLWPRAGVNIRDLVHDDAVEIEAAQPLKAGVKRI